MFPFELREGIAQAQQIQPGTLFMQLAAAAVGIENLPVVFVRVRSTSPAREASGLLARMGFPARLPIGQPSLHLVQSILPQQVCFLQQFNCGSASAKASRSVTCARRR